MGSFRLYLYLLQIFSIIALYFVSVQNETSTTTGSSNQVVVDIGLILDLGSSSGIIANSCISLAVSDFYTKNPHFSTRLALHHKNSDDIQSAASSALELVNEEQVDAIIGPLNSNQVIFIAEIGGKSQVLELAGMLQGTKTKTRPVLLPKKDAEKALFESPSKAGWKITKEGSI